MLPDNNNFWEFCVDQWRLPIVGEELLKLSIARNFDVVGGLYLAWLIDNNLDCSIKAFKKLRKSYTTVIDPLRAARRASKELLNEDLRRKFKSLEISTEKEFAAQLQKITIYQHTSDDIKGMYLHEIPENIQTIMCLTIDS